ncbi:MAG: NAD-dependent epimerase/dehydratase family protein [Acidobacteriia bacterium]|nr:NAD-dependent epimerase/dehydratase family protein [Terriglobia bacterium]
MARILITGGAGFIGTHLAERLSGSADVILFDNGRRDSLSLAPQLKDHPRVTFLAGDTLDPASITRAFERGVDTVVHLAAIAGVSSYYQEPLKTLQVNILGTINVLEESRRHGIKHFIDFSTSEIFGSNAMWVTEEMPCGIGPSSERRWVYATSKLATEHLTLRYGETYGFIGTVVRPFNIYGPRQTGEGAISNFCRAAIEGRPLTVYGDGSPIRAWCYVSDMVEAVERILVKPESAAGVFNVGNPSEIETTLGLARRIARLVPGTRIEFQSMGRAEVRARVPVIERARQLLGFEPKVDLEQGLQQTLNWYCKAKGVAK